MIIAYVNENAMTALATLETDMDISPKQDITIEFIDVAPLTAEIKYDGNEADISIYVRDELHANSEMTIHGTAKGEEISVDKGDEETVRIAYAVAEGVNKHLQDQGMLDRCAELNQEMQGVLFGVDPSTGITANIVEGKRRPALLCTTLFGAPRMMRPYFDEIMQQTFMDSMSHEEMEEAASAGDPDAMEQLALAYLNGDDEIDEDPEKAYYWFVKCAETGNDQAMFNAGLFTAKGFGTNRDFTKAAEWMQKAADAGDEDAEKCAIEYKKLADAIEKAKAGDAQAQADLAGGLMKLGGSLDQAGEDKDYEESVMWAEKAAAQGNPDGYWILALAYHHGRGVKKNISKAIEIYQKGADAGSASCQHNLGCEYLSGTNIKKNQRKAFELFKTAAEQGYGLAMRDLGRCYQFATGTPGNMKTAIEWYEKALKLIDDPELEQKTSLFKMMADADPEFGEDYPEEEYVEEDYSEDECEESSETETDKYMTDLVPEAVSNAWKYEDELDLAGVLPDSPHDEEAWEDLPRVNKKAIEGDLKAIKILNELDALID